MKNLFLPVLVILLFTYCEKQIPNDTLPENSGTGLKKSGTSKIAVCHHETNGSSHIININLKAWPEHQAHGDIRVDDQDGDGFVPDNPCGYGQMGDCDDLNASINPGVAEICGNSIDDNCNGKIDEDCIPSVTICNQTWMINNLDLTHYRNGDSIPQVQDPDEWVTLTTGAWCYYNNNASLGPVFGRLYNWYALVDPRGLAPEGWHIPSDAEWTELINCLGGPIMAGGSLKATGNLTEGTGIWHLPNTDATNISGFSGLPGGYRAYYFNMYYGGGYWWSTTESAYNANNAKFRSLKYNTGQVSGYTPESLPKYTGMSVRCLKD